MAHDHPAHAHHAPPRRARASLFGMGIGGRLGIAGALSGLVWAGIAWALR